ncbi:MAG: NADH-quinone oxidoreductase subunit L [Cytophagaceae bacterium]
MSQNLLQWVLILVLLFPALSFGVLFFAAGRLPRKGDLLAVVSVFISFVSAAILFINSLNTPLSLRFQWFRISSDINFNLSLLSNPVTSFMALVVTFISFLVNLYSLSYMKDKRNYERYFPYLSVFTFAMLGLVFSDNLLLTFVFWEMVGFSSYLLIGFWFDKEAAVKAGKKAFLFNRIGDLGFMVALMFLWTKAGTFEMSALSSYTFVFEESYFWWVIAGAGLFWAAVGKSAQFPLYVWLPDAMEGPTPVSALLHAATMVAAGVFLMARMYFFFPSEILTIIAVIGAITIIAGALPALVQNDIKKVLAFSTISQLGFMMVGIGTGASEAALFHLFTHAFFKAGLFLAAGAVIHEMHEVKHKLFIKGFYTDFDSQDMRLMGGFRKKSPLVFYCYLVCAASLAGLPFLSGFLSKDAILISAWTWASESASPIFYLVPLAGFLTVFFTSFYMFRQLYMVFMEDFRLAEQIPESGNVFHETHKTDWMINVPLVLLAILSVWLFFSHNPFDVQNSIFLKTLQLLPKGQPSFVIHISVILASVFLSLLGISAAYYKAKGYFKGSTQGFSLQVVYLLKNNWYLDEFYKRILIKPAYSAATIFSGIDIKVIDAFLHLIAISNVVIAHIVSWFDRNLIDGSVNLTAKLTSRVGKRFSRLQNGQIQFYILLTIIILILVMLIVYK